MTTSSKKGGKGEEEKNKQTNKKRQKYKEKTNCIFDLCITASPLPTCLAENTDVQMKSLILTYVSLQIRKTHCVFV